MTPEGRAPCLRAALYGQFTQVYHLHDERKVIAFHRWDKGGPANGELISSHQSMEG